MVENSEDVDKKYQECRFAPQMEINCVWSVEVSNRGYHFNCNVAAINASMHAHTCSKKKLYFDNTHTDTQTLLLTLTIGSA